MKRLACHSMWLSLVLMLGSPAYVAAQNKLFELGVGYQFVNRDDDLSFPFGVTVDFAGGLTERFALLGEFGWARRSAQQFGFRDLRTPLHAGGGVRWTVTRNHRFQPFAQAIVGVQRDRIEIESFGVDSELNFLVQSGGGLAVRFASHLDLFGGVDFRRVFHEIESTNAMRLTVGVRVR